MKRMVLIGVAVVVVAVGVYFAVRPRPVPVEMAEASVRTVREYIAEDAETRLADDYTIAMPVSGTLERIAWEIGDRLSKGECLARIDPIGLEAQIESTEALIAQAEAQVVSVDVAKPKPEDYDSAGVRVQEMRDALAMAQEERGIVAVDYGTAEREYERARALLVEGAVSQSRFDEAERVFQALAQNAERARIAEAAARKALRMAELAEQRLTGSVDDNEYLRDVYRAEIDGLRAQLRVLKDDLGKTVIEAPIDGFVLDKYIEDSRPLPAGTPLLKMGDYSTIEIESDILSEEVGLIEVGDPVEIDGKALRNETIMGSVKRIYPAGFKKISALGIEQQRVKILIDFDNEAGRLRPGTSVDIRVITDEHADTVAVPERATFRREGQWHVFVVQADRAVLTPVEAGLKNDDWAEVTSGLKAGETIVAEPKNELADGTVVSPL